MLAHIPSIYCKAAQVQSWIFSSFTYFSNILCAVKLKVLGIKAYWYTGSAFTKYFSHIYNMRNNVINIIFHTLVVESIVGIIVKLLSTR